MARGPSDIGASVRARLLNLARAFARDIADAPATLAVVVSTIAAAYWPAMVSARDAG